MLLAAPICVIDRAGSLSCSPPAWPRNILNEGLRVAVIEREPARLDLHHDAMVRQKDVIRGRKAQSGREAACPVQWPSAWRSFRDSGRGRCPWRWGADSRRARGDRQPDRINIDQLDDPVPESVPLVEAIRCAMGWPVIWSGSVKTSDV